MQQKIVESESMSASHSFFFVNGLDMFKASIFKISKSLFDNQLKLGLPTAPDCSGIEVTVQNAG